MKQKNKRVKQIIIELMFLMMLTVTIFWSDYMHMIFKVVWYMLLIISWLYFIVFLFKNRQNNKTQSSESIPQLKSKKRKYKIAFYSFRILYNTFYAVFCIAIVYFVFFSTQMPKILEELYFLFFGIYIGYIFCRESMIYLHEQQRKEAGNDRENKKDDN